MKNKCATIPSSTSTASHCQAHTAHILLVWAIHQWQTVWIRLPNHSGQQNTECTWIWWVHHYTPDKERKTMTTPLMNHLSYILHCTQSAPYLLYTSLLRLSVLRWATTCNNNIVAALYVLQWPRDRPHNGYFFIRWSSVRHAHCTCRWTKRVHESAAYTKEQHKQHKQSTFGQSQLHSQPSSTVGSNPGQTAISMASSNYSWL